MSLAVFHDVALYRCEFGSGGATGHKEIDTCF